MTVELDLRDQPEESHRWELFDALDGVEPGEDVDIVADRDVDPELIAYQIDRHRSLTWDHEDPDAEPREVRVTVGEALDEADLGAIDVRDLKPQRRHEALLQIFEDIEAGEGFVLVNDHDPKPLYHELRSMYGDVIDWEYERRGDGEWRVAIEKTGASEGAATDLVTRYDVREIPKQERHPTIHHRYGMIPEGGTLELIAPYEPRPLKHEFDQQYGDSFTWELVESDPGRCRVRITKNGVSDSTAVSEDDLEDTPAESEALNVVEEFDVRDRPPAKRHEMIYDAYENLDVGNAFVFINDHDPKPLYHQFEAEAGPEFRWEYKQKDPGEFRVLIGKSSDRESREASNHESASGAADTPF